MVPWKEEQPKYQQPEYQQLLLLLKIWSLQLTLNVFMSFRELLVIAQLFKTFWRVRSRLCLTAKRYQETLALNKHDNKIFEWCHLHQLYASSPNWFPKEALRPRETASQRKEAYFKFLFFPFNISVSHVTITIIIILQCHHHHYNYSSMSPSPLSLFANVTIIITRPWPAFGRHGLAGSLGGDQSGRINSSHSIFEELARFARSDWMGLSGGDQSGRMNSSHSIIEELACFLTSQKMVFSTQKWFSHLKNGSPKRKNHSIIDDISKKIEETN